MIYVDDIAEYIPKDSHTKRWGRQWCHMWTDGDLKELHTMAKKLGLKREYFQDHRTLQHYDLIPSKREKALKFGASAISLRTWLKRKKSCVEQS